MTTTIHFPMPVEDHNFTNGEPFIITEVETFGQRLKRLRYLLPDGSRSAVVIDASFDTPEMRTKLGNALLLKERTFGDRSRGSF